MIVLELEVIKETPQKRITLVRELDKRNIYIKKELKTYNKTIWEKLKQLDIEGIPHIYSIEENEDIKGVLIILNTVGGDVEAGLAMAELINSISKKVVTLVLGGSHSIGVPLATAGDYSFIAPTATMVVHPIRTNGLVIGVNETFEYFKKMQERITQFIIRTSNIEREELEKIMHSKEDLVSDVGSVLIGKEAVECGLIDEVGGLKDAMNKLKELIKESNNK